MDALVTVICEVCGNRNRLERTRFGHVEELRLTCIGCEERLKAQYTAAADRGHVGGRGERFGLALETPWRTWHVSRLRGRSSPWSDTARGR